MGKRLVFDTTDSDSLAASDKVGAFVTSDDGTLITHTTDGSREALDVFTELGQTEDAAHGSGDTGVMSLAVRNDTEGSLVDTDGDYAPLQVDSSGRLRVIADLDVTNLAEKAEDSAHTTADIGNFVLGIRMDDVDGGNGALLAGTEGDYQGLFTSAKGELHTRDNDSVDLLTTIDADTDTIAGDTTSIDATLTALSKAEDSVHGSGDQGIMALGVRNDAETPLAANGDYIPFMMDASGALLTISPMQDDALAETAIANDVNTLDVASTAEDVVTAPLTDRKYLWIYNNDNRDIFIGGSGVAVADGFPLPPDGWMELRIGAAVDIEWISTKASHEIRTLEIS